MLGVQGRWAAVAFVLTCACNARPLLPDAGAGAVSLLDSGTLPPTPDGSSAAGDGGTGVVEQPSCPPVDEPASPAPPAVHPARIPTTVPFSCQPMPEAFFFPPPGPDVPGQFSRCASFEVGAATSVAVSPDGRLAALMTADGLARVVEIAAHRVIAVLASPRAMIDYAAFAPDGRGIVTLARGQREVTLWRATDWSAVWTVSLPGERYYHMFGGGVAISPDGSAAVVSPGADSFLLDVATGAVRGTRTTGFDAVIDVGYGWGGRRIVLVEASLAAHCNHEPNGGHVVILDAATFAPAASVNYGSYPMVTGQPQFRASPTDDLVLVPAPQFPNQVTALKLSDGSPLPAPALTTLPLAFMPDGKTALVYDGGALLRVAVADASVTSVVMLGDKNAPFAVSADGGVVAFGGQGDGLLRVWNTGAGGGGVQTICSAAAPPSTMEQVSLSRDGQRLAIGSTAGVRVLRTSDGVTVARFTAGGRPILSPSGERLVTWPWDSSPVLVSRVADGALLAQAVQDGWYWGSFAFSAREDRLYIGGNTFRADQYGLDVVDLTSGSSAVRAIPLYTSLLGVSNGCPVLYQGERGVWRSCGGCEEFPIAGGGTKYDGTLYSNAVLSPGGDDLAISGAPGVTLWRMPPEAAALGTIGPRPDPTWTPREIPAAISLDGARLLTGTSVNPACYSGPGYEAHLHDTASWTLLDALPGSPVVDGALRTLAYGPQLWCAR